MKRFFAVLAVSAACLALTINAAPQALPVLYDSSIKTPAPSAPSNDIARVYKELLRVGGTQLKNQCFDGKLPATPKLSGLARGAFTRKGATQVAWLFELCDTKRYPAHGFYGLVISENGNVARVSSIEITVAYGVATEMYGVRDIDLDDTDELALVWEVNKRGYKARNLTLLRETPDGLYTMGKLQVYEYIGDAFGKTQILDWKVFVLKDKIPTFIAIPTNGKGPPVSLNSFPSDVRTQTFFMR